MSSTEPRHADGVSHHSSSNEEHELSDFDWTKIIWSLPIFVAILIGFTLLCVYAYQGYLNDEYRTQQAKFQPTEINILRAAENEILSQSKIIDKAAGRYQIPIAKAMELVVAEHQNISGRDWNPIADVYLQGAPFVPAQEVAPAAEPNGISIEEAVAPSHAATKAIMHTKKKNH